MILRPGIETFQPAALLVLAAALGYAVQNIATKKLTDDREHLRDRVLDERHPAAARAPGRRSLVRQQARRCTSCRRSAGLGIAGLSAHYCLTNAFRAGDASLVVPLDFLRIPLIAVVGWWLYGEPLDLFVFAGAGADHLGPAVEPAQRGAEPRPRSRGCRRPALGERLAPREI